MDQFYQRNGYKEVFLFSQRDPFLAKSTVKIKNLPQKGLVLYPKQPFVSAFVLKVENLVDIMFLYQTKNLPLAM